MTAKILTYQSRLFVANTSKGRAIQHCSRCDRPPVWAYINPEHPPENRSYCTGHAVMKAKANGMPLADLPSLIGNLLIKGESGEAMLQSQSSPPRKKVGSFNSWLEQTKSLLSDLESEIGELRFQIYEKEKQAKTLRSAIHVAEPEGESESVYEK